MALDWRGQIVSVKQVMPYLQGTRMDRVVFLVRFEAFDTADPPTVLQSIEEEWAYPLDLLSPLTVPQMANLVLVSGVVPEYPPDPPPEWPSGDPWPPETEPYPPGMRTRGADLLANYGDVTVVRGLPLPHVFGA